MDNDAFCLTRLRVVLVTNAYLSNQKEVENFKTINLPQSNDGDDTDDVVDDDDDKKAHTQNG